IPTSGLYIKNILLEEVKQKNVKSGYVTLHIGLVTFRQVTVDNVEAHEMHHEYYHLSKETAEIVNETKGNKGRIIAVGTTATRVLETVAKEHEGKFTECTGWTDIYIYTHYKFLEVDGLLNNLYLPN